MRVFVAARILNYIYTHTLNLILMDTVVLKSFDNYFSANITLTKLQQSGIECFLVDEYTVTIDPILSNAIGGIKLAVHIDAVPDATRLLQQFDEEYLRSVECPKCKRYNIMQVTRPGAGNFITAILTWLFSSYAVAPEKIYQCQDCRYESSTIPENNPASEQQIIQPVNQ